MLVVAGFVVAVGYGLIAPALPEYARSFGVGIALVSAVVSSFAFVRLASAPLSGRLVDRRGGAFAFCLGLLVVGGSSAASAFATTYAQLLVFRSLGGVGSSIFTVAAATLLIRMSPPAMRGRAMAAWASGFLAGTVAGPVIGGALLGISLRVPFLAYAALLAVVSAVLGARLRRHRVVAADRRWADAPTLSFAVAMRNPVFRAALASNFVDGWVVWGVRIALVPLFVVDVVATSGSWAGAALTAFAVGTVATLTLGGHLADRWGRRPTVVMGSLIVAATTVWLGTSTSPGELLAVCVLSGTGSGLMTPPVEAAVADVVGQGGGRRGGGALAGQQMAGDSGSIVGPLLGAWAVELGGYSAAFLLTAVVTVGSLSLWWQVPPKDQDTTAYPG
jgi:MFS family permease